MVRFASPEAFVLMTNPIARWTGAIHVYGADFFRVPRSEWDPERSLHKSKG